MVILDNSRTLGAFEMLWVYTYSDKKSLELDLMEIPNQMRT